MTDKSFLFEASNVGATLSRLLLIAVSHYAPLRKMLVSPISNYIYSPIVLSILARPHQSFTHVREAFAIRQLSTGRFVDAYQSNQSIRLPPLVLAAMLPLDRLGEQEDYNNIWASIVLLIVDFAIAYMIRKLGNELLLSPKKNLYEKEELRLQNHIASAIQPQNAHIFPLTRDPLESQENQRDTNENYDICNNQSPNNPLFAMECLPALASQLYYWSPITSIAGGTYHCFQNYPCFLLLLCLHEACRQRRRARSLPAFYLAVAAYIEPHFCVFLVPAILLSTESEPQKLNKTGLRMLMSFAFWSVMFQLLSLSLVGQGTYRSVLDACYGFGWKNLSPSLSLLWYFQIQLFGRFRDYFGIILTGLPFVLVVPLTTRLYKYPMAIDAIFWFIWTIFRPVQTLYDLNVGLCLFLLSPRSLARVTLPVFCIALCSLWVPTMLYVVDSWMWLEAGNGNANYIYFQCLGYNVFLGILVGQFCSATLQRDKALRLTAKNLLIANKQSK